MDKKIAGLLGAVGALASLNGAQAATSPEPSDLLKAQSYADLLKPIPNALEVLNAADSETTKMGEFQIAQNAHHHHHHHSYRRERRVIVAPRRHHHHHHHHHRG